MQIKLLFTFGCLLVLSPSSLFSNAATCPNAQAVSPCICSTMNTNANLLYLDCASKGLNDARIDVVLYLFQQNLDAQLGELDLSNNPLLTRVPSAIKTFTQLGSTIQLQQNSITSIESFAFQFLDDANPIQNFYLNSNKLVTIAPNAFTGVKAVANNTIIYLSSNQLTRFESSVFKSLLEKLHPFGGQPYANLQLTSSLFDCNDCHLAWLIRDNPHLLTPIISGTCANGTTFALLNANGYANCPTFVCPLGYDGNYADPLNTCNKYYICSGGIAYPSDCQSGLAFNPDIGRCDNPANVPGCT